MISFGFTFWLISPSGPLTVTLPVSSLASTPDGISIGFLPTLDMTAPNILIGRIQLTAITKHDRGLLRPRCPSSPACRSVSPSAWTEWLCQDHPALWEWHHYPRTPCSRVY